MNQFIKKLIIGILLFVFPPIGIYLAWKSKILSKGIKVLAIIIGIFNIIVWLTGIFGEEEHVAPTTEQVKNEKVIGSKKIIETDSKPEYIISITESKEDPGEYTAITKFESSLSEKGTLGKTFVRLCHTLKYLQKLHPNGKWYYAEVQDDEGNLIMAGNFKQGQVNLLDKKGNVALCKAVITKANTNMNRSYRAEINEFINNNYIPMM